MLLIGEMKFKRIHEILKTPTFYGDGPDWNDVIQGAVGNCYILASTGAIVEFPDLVKPVFITDQVNEAGIYAIRFYIRGKPWVVTIDDSILVDARNNPVFAPFAND
jgi:hypothetical protein